MNQTRVSTPTGRSTLIVMSIVVAITAFLYRLTTLGFSNDHFVHLARAQAMLAGDLPIRDYTEEGVPLTVLLSAGAQLLFGQSLFAEAMLVLISLSVAAGVTCWLTSRVTGSPGLGVWAALLQVAVHPRLYSHPKILFYSVFLLIAWWVLNAPSRRRIVVLALWTAIAFLVRHDHGVYIGLGAVATIVVAYSRNGTRHLIRQGLEYGLLVSMWLAPYLMYVQYHQGIIDYFRTGLAVRGSETSRTGLGRLTFDALPAGPWVAWEPTDPASFPGIRVRWKPEVDEARRQALEGELRLSSPERAEGRTWKYRIEPPGRETLSQLVSRPEVEDTSGFDRLSLTFADRPNLLARTLAATKLNRLARLDAGPRLLGLFSAHNVSLAFFFTIWSLPAIAVCLVVMTRGSANTVAPSPFILALSALVAVSAAGLLRDSLAERIPDIYGSLPMLVACTCAVAWKNRPPTPPARIAVGTAVVALSSAFVLGTFVLGQTWSRFNQAGFSSGPFVVWELAESVVRQTREWPWQGAWPAGSGWKVARYVHDCTRPDDRLLMTWSAPEMNVFSRRAFAGGETALFPVLRQPRDYEPSVLARLARQPVPIVLVAPEGLDEFHRAYPAISTYLHERYHKVGEFTPDARKIDIYVETSRRPVGIDEEFGWPCFVAK